MLLQTQRGSKQLKRSWIWLYGRNKLLPTTRLRMGTFTFKPICYWSQYSTWGIPRPDWTPVICIYFPPHTSMAGCVGWAGQVRQQDTPPLLHTHEDAFRYQNVVPFDFMWINTVGIQLVPMKALNSILIPKQDQTFLALFFLLLCTTIYKSSDHHL